MIPKLTPAQRLIIALDPDPGTGPDITPTFLKASQFMNTYGHFQAHFKFGTLGWMVGAVGLRRLKESGDSLFLDLKFNDTSSTMQRHGRAVELARPTFVTVSCHSGVEGMDAFNRANPSSLVLGHTVASSLSDELCQEIYGKTVLRQTKHFADLADDAGLSGLVCPAPTVATIRRHYPRKVIVAPGIRPEWSVVGDDDQIETSTPVQALRDGADYIVVGRPITSAEDPGAAINRIIEEIAQVHP